MKTFLRVLLNHLEKIVFAVLLLLLIVALLLQVRWYVGTMDQIREIQKIDITKRGTKKPLPTMDASLFNARVAVDPVLVWQPPPSVGTWQELAKTGASDIFKYLPKPPAAMTKRYAGYLDKFGPGSLFDPPLYVYPVDNAQCLLGFETVRAYLAPYTLDAPPRKAPEKPDDPEIPTRPGDPQPPPPPDEPLAKWVRLAAPFKPVYPDLPIVLSTVMDPEPKDKKTWTVTLKVNGTLEFVKMGGRIPGTDYVVEDASVEIVEGKRAFKVVVTKEGTDAKATLEKDKVTPDPAGEPYFNLIFFGASSTITKPFKMKNGDVKKLSFRARTTEYKLIVDGEQLSLVELEDGAAKGKPIPLGKYDADDYNEWKKKYQKKGTIKPPPTGPGGSEAMPMPPGGGRPPPGMPFGGMPAPARP